MEIFTAESLRQLAVINGRPCVSMYIPARRMGANSSIDATRMKNLMRVAESKLSDRVSQTDGTTLLNPLNELLTDRSVWNESEKGLAIFAAPGMFRTFRVPVDLEETVTVADRFDMIPLLSLGIYDGAFLLLSLDQHHIRLLRGTRQTFEEIELEQPLRSIQEFQRFVEPERQPQMHSGTRNMRGRRSKQDVVYHGGGSPVNLRRQDQHEFFRAIDHKVSHVAGIGDIPLLLAGTDYLRAIYRGVSRYPPIINAGIEGNTSRLTPGMLHHIGWLLVEPYFKRKTSAALGKLRSLMGTGLASDNMEEIAMAATEGRIETLLVVTSNRDSEETEREQDDIEKMKLIGSVLSTGGQVYPVADEHLQSSTGIAAVMRF